MPPNEIFRSLERAVQLHQQGALEEAEAIYRGLIQAKSQAPQAWHYLGLIAYQRGNVEEGIRLLEQAIALDFTIPEFHGNRGFMLLTLGRYDEARFALTRAIELRPDFPEALNNLGNVFKELRDYPAAIQAYERAISLQPAYADPYNNLGVVFQKMERWTDSVGMLERAIQIRPEFAVAYNNLAMTLTRLDRFVDAKSSFQRAIQIDPNHFEAWRNLGSLLLSEGELRLAIEHLEKAVSLKPDFADAWVDYGLALSAMGHHVRSQAAYEQALRFKPESLEANFNLGASKLEAKDYLAARKAFERVNTIDVGSAEMELIQIDQAECHWDSIPIRIERIRGLVRAESAGQLPLMSPFSFMTLPIETSPAEQLAVAKRWAAKFKTNAAPYFSHSKRRHHEHLRIGYLSADYFDHATSWLMAEMYEKHDRNAFKIYAYSIGPNDGKVVRKRIEQSVDQFRDVEQLSYRDTAVVIAADEIDILVDLKGYTQNARTKILAYRPAPIQVNYLGYPGTMGADFIDYLFADEYLIPVSQQPFYSEKVIYLPGCYQANDSTLTDNLEKPVREACGLPDDAIVCCSFNNPYKIAPEMLAIWMRLLKGNPKTVLWLVECPTGLEQHIRDLAAQQNVAPDRIVYAPKQSHVQHLARMACADLFLDSFPVNAHTTASDALRMGVPLLTLSGKSFISRVAGSLLNHLRMNELIATTYEEYEAKANELVDSRERLAKTKEKLAKELQKTDLFDGQAFARKIEEAFQDIWQRYLLGLSSR
jgi:protein O-GlcNAc transferase